jgi:hypothetical protein
MIYRNTVQLFRSEICHMLLNNLGLVSRNEWRGRVRSKVHSLALRACIGAQKKERRPSQATLLLYSVLTRKLRLIPLSHSRTSWTKQLLSMPSQALARESSQ